MTSPPAASHMDRALELARTAADLGEVPVGALIIGPDGRVIAEAHNLTRARKDPTAHAEMLAIQQAAAVLQSERLIGCDLYVTLEPCPMCAAAISFARLRRLYFGASDAKSGGVEHGPRVFSHATCHHAPEIYPGLGESESRALLERFFAGLREG
jgi:tRNA(Arg) A34 adenosine deaminase TadA